ncbi:MAG: hypothetical protein WA705_29685 [Candidatus Ozemobacteraceae bacterium]
MVGQKGSAGRKCLGKGVRPKLITTIDQATMEAIDRIGTEKHMSRGQVIDFMLEVYVKQGNQTGGE